MNWKLILQLSLFVLVMGVATVFVVPSSISLPSHPRPVTSS
ncbi:MAG TPA: hypothetical protein VGH98_01130 [Gemmatimonadaceae bacterium]